MVFPIVLSVTTLLLLPAYFIASLWRQRAPDRLTWLLTVLYSGAFLLYVFVAGRWDWLSYYLRYVWLALFVAAVFASFKRTQAPSPGSTSAGPPRRRRLGAAFTLAFFAALLGWAVRGRFYSEPPVALEFPLEAGWYYIGQGGTSVLVNNHQRSPAQQYALDILELNPWGGRAAGLYPTDLSRYAIFDRPVLSPCGGTVTSTERDLPDLIPPEADRDDPAGNHVVIACQGAEILVAHLRQGSVAVDDGDTVSEGQPLGRVGNSGNTSEPHLHIHAVRAGSGGPFEGDAVPMLFEKRFPIRNTTF